jgi:VanZ family protein
VGDGVIDGKYPPEKNSSVAATLGRRPIDHPLRTVACVMAINLKKKVAYWFPVVVLCIAIFVQSCLPAFDVGPRFQFKDKFLHAIVYGLLASLFFRAYHAGGDCRKSLLSTLVISVCFATLYGISDEIHQAFVPGRYLDGMDAVANFIGSVLGSAGYLWVVADRRPGCVSDTDAR